MLKMTKKSLRLVILKKSVAFNLTGGGGNKNIRYSLGKVLFPIKQVLGGRRRKKETESKFTVFNFQSNKWWVEAMAPTHLAQLPDRGTWSVAPHRRHHHHLHRHRCHHHRRHRHHHRHRHLDI